MKEAKPWDMAVVGAGPAGSVCAYSALGASGPIRVALIDRDVFPRDKSCGDAIPLDAAVELKELGLGEIVGGRPEIRQVRVTCPTGFDYLKRFTEKAELAYYFVERMAFDRYLFAAAIERGAQDYTGYKLTDGKFDETRGLWRLTLLERSGVATELCCGVLVGADGAGSQVRRLAGLERNEDAHIGLGLRAYAQARDQADDTVRIDYLESLIPAPAWTAPLGEGKVNLGLGIDKRDYRRKCRPLRSYLDEYVQYLQADGVTIENLGNIKTHPLPFGSQAVPLAPGKRTALIGDAASMIDPFTGDGIHCGIWAGRFLGNSVARCMKRGGDVQTALENYATAYAERFGRSMETSQSTREWIRFHALFR